MKRLLIVSDYQKDFVIGPLGFPRAITLDIPISNKIKDYRITGDTVVFVFDTHNCNYLNTQEGKNLPVEHCIEGTDGWNLFGETGKQRLETDICFVKDTFGSGRLYSFLLENSFDQIEIVGVLTNICVLSNAVIAKTASPEALIVVDSKCVASNDDVINDYTLQVMKSMQIEVR